MIHVVTAANRALYQPQIEEMHRLRWDFYIEQRAWSALRCKQTQPGHESDEYDDARAVYLLSLSAEGSVQGAMRIRPTDDRSLLMDQFSGLVDESDFEPAPDIWEITRLMRAPAFRGADGALRLAINCAACEFALTRGIRQYVTVADTFLLPAARALHRHKHHVLGLPADYDEGEMIALAIDPDAEWLAMGRTIAGFTQPMMIELPPPASGPHLTPVQEQYLIERLRALRAPSVAAFADALRAASNADSNFAPSAA